VTLITWQRELREIKDSVSKHGKDNPSPCEQDSVPAASTGKSPLSVPGKDGFIFALSN
jgi:hypothetical protein